MMHLILIYFVLFIPMDNALEINQIYFAQNITNPQNLVFDLSTRCKYVVFVGNSKSVVSHQNGAAQDG